MFYYYFRHLAEVAEVTEVTETPASLAIMKKVLRVMPEPCERMQFVKCFLAVNSSCWYSLPSARSGASLLSPSSYACTGFADSKHSVDDLRLNIE